MDCLYFHLEKAFRLKDSDLHVHFRDTLEVTQFIQFMHIWQVINFLTEIILKNMMYLPFHLFFGVYRKGITMVGPGGERTQGQGPEMNADFLVIIFETVKYH